MVETLCINGMYKPPINWCRIFFHAPYHSISRTLGGPGKKMLEWSNWQNANSSHLVEFLPEQCWAHLQSWAFLTQALILIGCIKRVDFRDGKISREWASRVRLHLCSNFLSRTLGTSKRSEDCHVSDIVRRLPMRLSTDFSTPRQLCMKDTFSDLYWTTFPRFLDLCLYCGNGVFARNINDAQAYDNEWMILLVSTHWKERHANPWRQDVSDTQPFFYNHYNLIRRFCAHEETRT